MNSHRYEVRDHKIIQNSFYFSPLLSNGLIHPLMAIACQILDEEICRSKKLSHNNNACNIKSLSSITLVNLKTTPHSITSQHLMTLWKHENKYQRRILASKSFFTEMKFNLWRRILPLEGRKLTMTTLSWGVVVQEKIWVIRNRMNTKRPQSLNLLD